MMTPFVSQMASSGSWVLLCNFTSHFAVDVGMSSQDQPLSLLILEVLEVSVVLGNKGGRS